MMANVIKYSCKFFIMLNHANLNVLIDRDNDRDITILLIILSHFLII